MIKVVITGGIASGKSTALNYFKKRFYTLSADEEIAKIYNMQKISDELKNNLGVAKKEEVKELIKKDPYKIKLIERILYKELNKNFRNFERMCRRKNQKYCFYEIPLVFEKNMQRNYDLIINIESTLFKQKSNFLRRKNGDIKLFNFLKNNQFTLEKRRVLTKKNQGITILNLGCQLKLKNKILNFIR